MTDVERLVRDPYAIYARRVLGLRPLPPLRPPADAAVRGSVVHAALADLGDAKPDADALMGHLDARLAAEVDGAGRRSLWRARFARIVDGFLAEEAERRRAGAPVAIETRGEWAVPGTDVTLVGVADRIDDRGAAVAIFDYKTGAVPSAKQQRYFARQLLLEMLMVEAGAFPDLGGPRTVERVAYLGVGGTLASSETPVTAELRAAMAGDLVKLLTRYAQAATPFPARLAHEHLDYAGDYDHLARFGEWDDTRGFHGEDVG